MKRGLAHDPSFGPILGEKPQTYVLMRDFDVMPATWDW
jgi:hypothetical protein